MHEELKGLVTEVSAENVVQVITGPNPTQLLSSCVAVATFPFRSVPFSIDNASVMRKAQKLIQEEWPHIIVTGMYLCAFQRPWRCYCRFSLPTTAHIRLRSSRY